MKSLSRALIVYEKITTTEAKAKELRRYIEPVITSSKKNTVFQRRLLAQTFDEKVVEKLVSRIGPRYLDRPGGYTRITKRNARTTDAAPIAVIELV